MLFTCEKDTLVNVITSASRAVSSRAGALPVLSGLQLTVSNDTLSVIGSDLELTIKATAPVSGHKDGTVVVPSRLFTDIVKSLSEKTVTVSASEEELKIESGRSNFSVRTLPATDFPKITKPEGTAVRVDSQALSVAMEQVTRAASKDDSRPILTGVLIASTETGIRLVATDSYRLAVRDLPGVSFLSPGQRVLVAAKGLSEVQKTISNTKEEIEITLSEREVVFQIKDTEITTRLIEGEFPNYEQLIPSGYPNRTTVKRSEVAEATKRVRLVGAGRDNAPLRLAMSGSGMELSVVAQDVGQATESVDAKFEGADLTVAFNPEYLLDGLNAIEAEEVVIETVDPLKPATIHNIERDDFLYLLMPMRIS